MKGAHLPARLPTNSDAQTDGRRENCGVPSVRSRRTFRPRIFADPFDEGRNEDESGLPLASSPGSGSGHSLAEACPGLWARLNLRRHGLTDDYGPIKFPLHRGTRSQRRGRTEHAVHARGTDGRPANLIWTNMAFADRMYNTKT